MSRMGGWSNNGLHFRLIGSLSRNFLPASIVGGSSAGDLIRRRGVSACFVKNHDEHCETCVTARLSKAALRFIGLTVATDAVPSSP